jgi:hypothetical protein
MHVTAKQFPNFAIENSFRLYHFLYNAPFGRNRVKLSGGQTDGCLAIIYIYIYIYIYMRLYIAMSHIFENLT